MVGVAEAPRQLATSLPNNREIVVTDIKMPFGSMVIFMIKWAIASIPAVIILAIMGSVAWGFILAFLSGLLGTAIR